jgi:hypothetical protein
MTKQTLEQVPLVCTPEISKAIHHELTLGGRVECGELLVVGGANWQKNRIIECLEGKLAELQAQLTKMNETSARRAAVLFPQEIDRLGTVNSFFRGGLEGQIELLQFLISRFK